MGLTSETGMPVELCSDSDLADGVCERGIIFIKIFILFYL